MTTWVFGQRKNSKKHVEIFGGNSTKDHIFDVLVSLGVHSEKNIVGRVVSIMFRLHQLWPTFYKLERPKANFYNPRNKRHEKQRLLEEVTRKGFAFCFLWVLPGVRLGMLERTDCLYWVVCKVYAFFWSGSTFRVCFLYLQTGTSWSRNFLQGFPTLSMH